MNGYGRISHIKADLAGVSGTSLDDALIRLRDEVSREFDRATRREFFTTTATLVFSGDGTRRYLLGKDLLSVTSIKVADTADQPTTFENTLVVNDDYTLWPPNAASEGKPYRAIVFNPNGQYGVAPVGVDNIQVVGDWGYSETWQDSGIVGTLSDASDTSLTATATADSAIDPGDMIKLEDEQLEVTGVSGTGVTVVRGRNGTTAAAHAGVAISIRRYPPDVENAVKERCIGRRWDSQGGYDAGVTLSGDSMNAVGKTTGRGIYSRWRDACAAYTNPAAVL